MNWIILYWWLKLDTLRCFLMIPTSIWVIVSLIVGSVSLESGTNLFGKIKPKITYPICVILFLIGIMLPSTKEFAVLYTVPKIVGSKIVTEDIPQEVKEIYSMAKEYFKNTITKGDQNAETQ
jgi:fumarate reductase subunit C